MPAADDLLIAFQQSGDTRLLDQAVLAAGQAVDATDPQHPDRALHLNNLGLVLQVRSVVAGAPADLRQAEEAVRAALAVVPADDPHRAVVLGTLAHVLALRSERDHTGEPLDEAEGLCREALAAVPADRPGRAGLLSTLSAILTARFVAGRRPERIDEAIEAARAALRGLPAGDSERPVTQLRLAGALQARLQLRGDPADREALVAGLEEADRDAGADAVAAALSAMLAFDRWQSFTQSQGPGDLDRFLAAVRRPLNILAPDAPQRPVLQMLAGTSHWLRFGRAGQAADLDDAVTALRHAEAAMAPDDPSRPDVLANLGASLWARYERAGRTADVLDAVTFLQEALDLRDLDPARRAAILGNLGLARWSQFRATDHAEHLTDAVDLLRRALNSSIADSDRCRMSINLGLALGAAFERTGDVDALGEAVAVLRDSAAATPPDTPDRGAALTNLGAMLLLRFERLGELGDVEEALQALRDAERTPTDDPARRALIAGNIGLALLVRHERVDDPDALDGAVRHLRAAVAAVPLGDRAANRYQTGLCMALRARFEAGGEQTDIDQAVQAGRAAVGELPPGDPALPFHLGTLGGALLFRGGHHGGIEDLDEAIAALRSATAGISEDHPDRAGLTHTLAHALIDRHTQGGAGQDAIAEALSLFRAVASSTSVGAGTRLMSARSWGQVAAGRGDWRSAAEGYAAAVRILPTAAWRGTSRRSREQLLGTNEGLAGDAAACAILAGAPDLAVELLEQGRAVLLSEIFELRTDLVDLATAKPELAARLDAVRVRLDLPRTVAGATGTFQDPATATDARMALARQWEALLEEVRGDPRFRRFLRPPVIADLRAAAVDGPVVLINVSHWGCHLLVVTTTGTRVVPVRATRQQIIERVNTYLTVLQEYEAATDGGPTGGTVEATVTATLEWLWDTFAEAALAACPDAGGANGGLPRLWWCTTGPLAALPLHAAGYHGPADPPGRTVLDRVVSSFTPTLRALISARAGTPAPSGRLLLVAIPNTPGHVPLGGIETERTALVQSLHRTAIIELVDDAAGRTATLRQLARHSHVHASCHGEQDLAAPSDGGLMPYDWRTAGPIRVPDLASRRDVRGEFIFLSACKTSLGGVVNIDEAITLTSALQFSGWRHVIGTLWSVGDRSAAAITSVVYRELAADGILAAAGAARALHTAVRERRAAPGSRTRPSRWVGFVHTGP